MNKIVVGLVVAVIAVLSVAVVSTAIGYRFAKTEMAQRNPVASTQSAVPASDEPSIAPAPAPAPVADQSSSGETPSYGAEDDGPGPGYDGEGYIGPEIASSPASVFGGVYTINLEGDTNCAHGSMDLEVNLEPKSTPPYIQPVSVVIREPSGEGHPSNNPRFTYEDQNTLSFIFPFVTLSGDERILRGKITADGRIEGTQTYHDVLSESLGMSGLADGKGTFSGSKIG